MKYETEEARLAARKESQKKYLEKLKQEKINAENNTNYKQLYEEAQKEIATLTNKTLELEKICKSLVEREQNATKMLHNATLEYNSRTKHMLDCVKHAYISMQFALNAEKGENKND